IGAIVPLISYLAGSSDLYVALAMSAGVLFAAGAVVARLTRQPLWYGGVRQLVLAVIAASVTYGVGRAIGTSVN
ncbi:MAG: vacuolar iron transporter family protein, partial [Frankiaceae bacterium]|nr:vacuolar iron transporter family protein [Frankiaceae bacterium]